MESDHSPSHATLDAHVDPAAVTTSTTSNRPKSYTYYHAGPLFTLGDLTNNVRLSTAVYQSSQGKYQPVLPQDLEQRDTSPHSIRDDDIKALLSCDLALFTYDGAELDSGTVIEYMVAKFADIPAVILRTDFRGGGDQASHQGDPWNLMSSFWPRSVGVVVNGMLEYKTGLAHAMRQKQLGQQSARGEDGEGGVGLIAEKACQSFLSSTAGKIVDGFDKVLEQPPRLPKELRSSVYQWLALLPGFKDGNDGDHVKHMLNLLEDKTKKGLF